MDLFNKLLKDGSNSAICMDLMKNYSNWAIWKIATEKYSLRGLMPFNPLVRSLFSTATAYSIFMDGGVVGVKRGRGRPGVGGVRSSEADEAPVWGMNRSSVIRNTILYFICFQFSVLYSTSRNLCCVARLVVVIFQPLWNLSNNHLAIFRTWSNNFYHHRVIYVEIDVVMLLKTQTIVTRSDNKERMHLRRGSDV